MRDVVAAVYPHPMGPHTLSDRERYWGPAVSRFAAANNIPLPAPLTPDELADFERRNDEADRAAERLYGLGPAAAA